MDDLVLIFALRHPLASSPEDDLSPELIGSSSFVLHIEKSSTRRMTEKWLQSSRVHLPYYPGSIPWKGSSKRSYLANMCRPP
ncbi:hypothetical protein [Paenibacillus sp. UNC451MF]|uniref:hypothetical protein n=1 Tax=Paenibacillus sp. UNC451MF TaxID=1449063 RepID=UPI0012DE6438|nr:hypothetical protein [Paenibacillus sp. UNC451MF]